MNHVLRRPCRCIKLQQIISHVFQEDRVTFPLFFSLLFCAPTWRQLRQVNPSIHEDGMQRNIRFRKYPHMEEVIIFEKTKRKQFLNTSLISEYAPTIENPSIRDTE
mgnify:CR=1 FL=1